MDFARVSTWILVTGTTMIGIIGIVGAARYVAAKSVPILSSLAQGLLNAWKVAAV